MALALLKHIVYKSEMRNPDIDDTLFYNCKALHEFSKQMRAELHTDSKCLIEKHQDCLTKDFKVKKAPLRLQFENISVKRSAKSCDAKVPQMILLIYNDYKAHFINGSQTVLVI